MKKIFIIILTCLSISAFGQTSDSLEIANLKTKVARLERQINEIKSQQNALFNQQQKVNDTLKNQLKAQSNASESMKTTFNQEIDRTNSNLNTNVESLNQAISTNNLFAIVGIVVAIVLLIVVGLVLWKRISSKDTAIDQIKNTQKSLESAQKSMQEESVKLDGKLVELLEKQMATQSVQHEKTGEQDHSLALKVADEIIRIETNLSKMDSSIKGYKQLSKAVERIRTNFLANGYEIVDMLGKPYHESMRVTANFVSDETLTEGEQKITGITKPQINYNGKMIQSAQITVSQNI